MTGFRSLAGFTYDSMFAEGNILYARGTAPLSDFLRDQEADRVIQAGVEAKPSQVLWSAPHRQLRSLHRPRPDQRRAASLRPPHLAAGHRNGLLGLSQGRAPVSGSATDVLY